MQKVYHELKPIYNKDSEILILGSIPSVKSREEKFYYAHKQNRFWPLMESLFQVTLKTKEEKIEFLLTHHIALWDVVASCEIENSRDDSIHNVKCNDILNLMKQTKIHKIFTTGKKATDLYQKYIYPQTKIPSIYLPSPSPANCRMKHAELEKIYSQIKSY